MTQDNQHRPLHFIGHTMLHLIQAIAVGLVFADLLLMSGIFDRHIIPFLPEQFFDVGVTMRMDGWRPTHVGAVKIQAGNTTPLLQVDGVGIRYQREFGSVVPRIASVNVWRPQLHLDGSDPNRANYAFLRPYFGGGSGDSKRDMARWLPRSVAVHEISLKTDMPDWSATVSGMNMTAQIEGMNRMTAQVSGDAVRAGWQSGHDWLDIPLPEGRVDANISISPEDYNAQASVHLPDFLVLDGSATLTMSPEISLNVAVKEMRLDAPVFGAVASQYSPLAIAYDSIVIAPFNLDGMLVDKTPVISEAQCDMRMEGLVLGDPGAPWYSGNLSVEASGEHGANSQAIWSATLNQGQQVSGMFSSDDSGLNVAGNIEDWKSASILSLWPEPYAAWEVWLPEFQKISGGAECRVAGDIFALKGNISAVQPSGNSAAITATGNYARDAGKFDMAGDITLGNGKGTFKSAWQDRFTMDVTADSVAASDVFALLPWEALRGVHAAVSGKAELTTKEEGDYAFSVDVSALTPAYGEWVVPEALGALELSGTGVMKNDFSGITGDGVLRLADNATADIKAFRYDIEKSRIATTFDGTAALTSLAAAIGYPDLWGDATVSGQLTVDNWNRGEISALRIVLESLGYGEYSLPYGKELIVDAPARFDVEAVSLNLGPIQLVLGEGTKLNTEAMHLTPDSIAASSPILFETDFAPLVAKQFLATADGQVKVSVEEFKYGGEGVSGNIQYSCAATRIVLPEKLADIQGLTAEGTITLHPQMDGKGLLKINELLVGGITLKKTGGEIVAADNGLMLEGVNFELFGGGVVARVELHPFDAGMPVSVSGEVDNIDLSLFTEEFEPPSLVLTGRVNGTFAVGLTAQQLTRFDVDLIAAEEFTMNRDMVEQLLLSQYVDEMAGGKQMTRVLQSVIGKDSQRKFDGARLVLGLEDGRIVGYAKLESKALNLTVDIKADPAALLEALKTRQQ